MPTTSSPTFRDRAIAALQRLPKNSSADDLHHRLYVLEKIEKSEAAVRERGVVSHARARQRMRKWLTKG